ncbi:MAG: hypothetical protein ABW252_01275 [Polyangiales bacterium]
MIRRPRRALLFVAIALVGCGAPRALNRRIAEIEQLAQAGRDHGAYRCAPEELALATAHLEFAHLELAQGDVARAREHLVLADANARAAMRLSALPSCASGASDAPEARVLTTPFHARERVLQPRQAAHPRSTHGHVRS